MTGTDPAELISRLKRHRPQMVELASYVSLTVSVDRAFLRKARLRFLPRTAAGLEAELWFSPLVEAAGSRALLLDPEASEHLRRDLAQRSPQLLQQVREFTVAEHTRAPLVVRLYEELLWSALQTTETVDTHARHHADRVLRMVSGEGVAAAVADDTGRWALHYARRLPTHLLGRDDVWRIQVASCERLGLGLPDDPAGGRTGVTVQARARVQHTLAIGVTARSDGIVLSRPPASGARILHAQGTRHKVRLDAVSSLAHTAEPIRLDLLDGQSVHLPFTVVQRTGPDGDLRMSLSHPGSALEVAVADYTGSDPSAAHCAVLLPDGTIVLHGGDGSESGRVLAESPLTTRSDLVLSADGTTVSYVQNNVRHHRSLRPGVHTTADPTVENVQGSSSSSTGTDATTVASRARDGSMDVRATTDGRILATSTAFPGRRTTRLIGQAPWRVSSLAISADAQWVAVVGNDSLLMELPLAPGRRPRETQLRFCATRVFAGGDGGWVIAGTGGPVGLNTEEGRSYRIMPEVDPAVGVSPTWGYGCVLVDTPVAQMDVLTDIPGVDCLLVDLNRASGQEHDEFALRLVEAHRRGVRVVCGLDVSDAQEEVLDAVCHWLDQSADGLRLAGSVGAAILNDVRHLVDGYDDRMLLCAPSQPSDRRNEFHVVPASPLVSTLGFALRSRTMAGGAFEQAMTQLRREIEDAFSASFRTLREGRVFQWGLELPPALPQSLRKLAVAILLSLPGCPVLPGRMLLEDGGGLALRRLLELRRNHLALSRGDCLVVDVGTAYVLAVARRHGDDAVLCLVNVAHIPTTVEFRPGQLGATTRLQDLFDGSVLALSDETSLTVPLTAGSVRWFRCIAQ